MQVLHADVDVELDVVDRNNKPPVWDANVYGPIHIKENVTVGTVVTSVKARFVCHDMTETRHVTCRAVPCSAKLPLVSFVFFLFLLLFSFSPKFLYFFFFFYFHLLSLSISRDSSSLSSFVSSFSSDSFFFFLFCFHFRFHYVYCSFSLFLRSAPTCSSTSNQSKSFDYYALSFRPAFVIALCTRFDFPVAKRSFSVCYIVYAIPRLVLLFIFRAYMMWLWNRERRHVWLSAAR